MNEYECCISMSSCVLWWMEVCTEYEPTEDEYVVAQTSHKIRLKCIGNFNTGQFRNLICVSGKWVNDGQQVKCSVPTTAATTAEAVKLSVADNPGICTQRYAPS